jgi:hypothetical protein
MRDLVRNRRRSDRQLPAQPSQRPLTGSDLAHGVVDGAQALAADRDLAEVPERLIRTGRLMANAIRFSVHDVKVAG